MKKLIVLIITFTSMPFLLAQATENNCSEKGTKSYSLYLLRNAEKQMDKDDLALTQCGKFGQSKSRVHWMK